MDKVPSHPSAPGRVYIGINALFTILVTFMVGLRFWARHLKRSFFGWDDWCILAALLIFYGQSAFNYWVVYHGALGYHVAQAGEVGVRNMFLQLTISQFIYAVQFFMIRLSICFLLKRIFVQAWLQRTVLVAIGVNFAWAIFVIITALAVCRPIAYNWDQRIRGGYCRNDVKLNTYIANAVWTILYDSFLWSLPQFIVWRLHMQMAAKIAISMFFALGVFDIVVSIVRISYVVKVDFADVTYADFQAQIWTTIEVSVAIIVACLPLCRVIVEHVPRRFKSSSRKQPRTPEWANLEAQAQNDRQPLHRDNGAAGSRSPFEEELNTIELQFPMQVMVHAQGTDSGREAARDYPAKMGISRDAAPLGSPWHVSGGKSL